MSYPNKKQKKTKTPVPKGLLTYCPSCINYITQSEQEAKIKYPCKLSHSQIRRGAGINYARDFKDCALYKDRYYPEPDRPKTYLGWKFFVFMICLNLGLVVWLDWLGLMK